VTAVLMLDDTEKIQASDVVRVGGEKAPIDLFGFRQTAVLVMLERC
jgi:hypothetical protein